MFTFYFSNKPLGASTAYARVAGMLGTLVAPKHTKSLKYYQENKPVVDWEVMLVLGAVLGAFLLRVAGKRIDRRMAATHVGGPLWGRQCWLTVAGGTSVVES